MLRNEQRRALQVERPATHEEVRPPIVLAPQAHVWMSWKEANPLASTSRGSCPTAQPWLHASSAPWLWQWRLKAVNAAVHPLLPVPC